MVDSTVAEIGPIDGLIVGETCAGVVDDNVVDERARFADDGAVVARDKKPPAALDAVVDVWFNVYGSTADVLLVSVKDLYLFLQIALSLIVIINKVNRLMGIVDLAIHFILLFRPLESSDKIHLLVYLGPGNRTLEVPLQNFQNFFL